MADINNTYPRKMFSMSKAFVQGSTIVRDRIYICHQGGLNGLHSTGWLGRLLSLSLLSVVPGSALADPGDPSVPASATSQLSQTGFTPEFIAILITAVVALFCAGWLSRSTLRIARKRAAMDALMEARRDSTLQKGIEFLRQVDNDESQSIEAFYNASCDKPEVRSQILYVLNYYESVAVAIHNGIYDEGIYKSAQCTIILRIVAQSESFILAVQRKDSETAFQELMELKKKWKVKPITVQDAGKPRAGRMGIPGFG